MKLRIEILQAAVAEMERLILTVESEWGGWDTIEQIEAHGQLPEAYVDLRALLQAEQGMTPQPEQKA